MSMNLNPVDALADGVSNGIDKFAIGIGNDLVNSSNVNGTYDGKLIIDVATFTYNPFRDPAVISILKESALLYVLFGICFILVGGAYVQISRMRAHREFLGMELNSGLSLSNFYRSVFGLILLAPVVPFMMWVVLMFNSVLCKMIMSGIISSILFTPDNVALYVAMCFIYAVMSYAFIWRSLVIGITVGYCLILIILYAIPFTRNVGKGVFVYWLLMVFMQPVILAFTCVGVGIIKCISAFNINAELSGYFVLCILLVVVSLVFIFGPYTIMKVLGSAKNKLKLVL